MVQTSAYVYKSRHNVFYFRLRIPQDIYHLTSQRQIRRSLKTNNRRQACILSAQWLECCERAFEQARLHGHLSIPLVHQQEDNVKLSAVADTIHRKKAPLLSVVARELSGILEQEGVTASVIDGKLAIVRLMTEIVGDLPVDAYSRPMARKFKDRALKLPPRTRGNSHLSVEQAIASANGKTISVTTFNNYVKDLASVFNFAIREGYCGINPMSGMKLKTSQKANQGRQRYTQTDISRLFSSSIHCSGGEGEKAFKYWLPLLAVYTGARLNELCQLYLDDVVVLDGIPCLRIQDIRNDQRVKNKESCRVIPIHSYLLQLGLLDYVGKLRHQGQVRLFPELSYQEKRGYSALPSKWFAKFKKEQLENSVGQSKDFHSFRHTVADCFKQLGLPEALAAAVLGHRAGGITYHRYGKDYPPEALFQAIEAINWSMEEVAVFRI